MSYDFAYGEVGYGEQLGRLKIVNDGASQGEATQSIRTIAGEIYIFTGDFYYGDVNGQVQIRAEDDITVLFNEVFTGDSAWSGTFQAVGETSIIHLQLGGGASKFGYYDNVAVDGRRRGSYETTVKDLSVPGGGVAPVRAYMDAIGTLHAGESAGQLEPLLEIRFGTADDPLMWSATPTDLMWDADPTTLMWEGYTVYQPWVSGVITTGFIQYKIIIDSGIGHIDVTKFIPIYDVEPLQDADAGVVVAIGGTTINFTTKFIQTPKVVPMVPGASALIAVAGTITTSSFKAYVFDTAGTDVGGTISWIATTE